jgi:hypothetical protein
MNLLEGEVYTVGTFLSFISEMILLSPLIGFGFGYVAYRVARILHHVDEHHNMDLIILVTIVCAYSSFYVAQAMVEVSGVLSCCAAGLCLSVLLSPDILENGKMHRVWHLLEWSCNTAIFFLAGIIGGVRSGTATQGTSIGYVFAMYIFLFLTRGVTLFILWPLLNRCGEPFSWAEVFFACKPTHVTIHCPSFSEYYVHTQLTLD